MLYSNARLWIILTYRFLTQEDKLLTTYNILPNQVQLPVPSLEALIRSCRQPYGLLEFRLKGKGRTGGF